MSAAAIELRDIHAGYDDREVLHDARNVLGSAQIPAAGQRVDPDHVRTGEDRHHAGLLGGVMAPLSGFSGLAPALWATLRGYAKDEHRAVLQNFNLIVLSATFASNVWAGRVRSEHLTGMAVVAGSLVLPSLYGSKIYTGMSPSAFRNGVLWILVFAGVTMLVASLRALL